MNKLIYQTTIIILTLLLSVGQSIAQQKDTTEIIIDGVKILVTDNGDTIKRKTPSGRHSIEISTNGIKYRDALKTKKKHKKLHVGMHFDFGINNVADKTDYSELYNTKRDLVINDTGALRMLTKNDLNLNNARSINFNFWPVWLKQDIAKHNVQIETGLGFQFFNYRYQTTVTHSDEVINPNVIPFNPNQPVYQSGFESINDQSRLTGKEKNKLGVSYVSIPLMIRFNSDKKKGHSYFVGAGVIGSYKLKSWTKFYGEKNSGDFGINDWMTQLTAEIGVTGVIKLYGTYALQSMYNYGLDRSPFAIGVRL